MSPRRRAEAIALLRERFAREEESRRAAEVLRREEEVEELSRSLAAREDDLARREALVAPVKSLDAGDGFSWGRRMERRFSPFPLSMRVAGTILFLALSAWLGLGVASASVLP